MAEENDAEETVARIGRRRLRSQSSVNIANVIATPLQSTYRDE